MSEQEQHGESQPQDVLPIVALYNAVEVPRNLAHANPEDPRLQNRINRFFYDIIGSLHLNDLMQETAVVIETKRVPAEKEASYDEQQSLALRDLQILATVHTIVQGGMVSTIAAEKKPLEDKTIAAIKGLHEGDTFLTHVLFRE